MQPLPDPLSAPPEDPYVRGMVTGPAPWSALAIAGFVMSLLGFLGFTAILGIIFGIVGILVTRGRRRRGRGLAIAAIPISLVTGAISIVLVLSIIFMGRVMRLPEELKHAFAADVSAGAPPLRALATDDFNAAVSDEALRAWLSSVFADHGTLIDLQRDLARWLEPLPDGRLGINLAGKFVNGAATVRVTYSSMRPTGFDNIEVGGSSPLGSN